MRRKESFIGVCQQARQARGIAPIGADVARFSVSPPTRASARHCPYHTTERPVEMRRRGQAQGAMRTGASARHCPYHIRSGSCGCVVESKLKGQCGPGQAQGIAPTIPRSSLWRCVVEGKLKGQCGPGQAQGIAPTIYGAARAVAS